MRRKMRDAHGNKGELFDLKHDTGGLVDVEFLIQYLVLGHSHDHPRLTGNLGNIALLRIASTSARSLSRSRRMHSTSQRIRSKASPIARSPAEKRARVSAWCSHTHAESRW